MDDAPGDHEPVGVSRLRVGWLGGKRSILEWLTQLAAVVVGIVVVLVVAQFIWGGGVDHESLDSRLQTLESEARFQSCLLQFIPEERSPAVVAGCATEPTVE